MTLLQRSALSVDHPEPQQGMTPQHRVRPLMPAAMRGDYAAVDPFLGLMEDWFPRGVFGKHPHRGIETVTYVLDGRIDHYDNQGHEGAILPGDAQWMTAGRGLIHNEIPAEGQTVHSLQLWVNLPAAQKMVAPRYQDLVARDMPVRREPGAEIRVFSGSSGGVSAPTRNFVPVTMVEFRLDAGRCGPPGPASRLQRVRRRPGRRRAGRRGGGRGRGRRRDVADRARGRGAVEVAGRGGREAAARATIRRPAAARAGRRPAARSS